MSAETGVCKEASDLENCLIRSGSFKCLSHVDGDYNVAVSEAVRNCNLLEEEEEGSYEFRRCSTFVNGDSIDKALLMEEDPKLENGCLNHDVKVQFEELSVENAEADSQEGKIDLGLVVLSVKPVSDKNQTVVIDTANDVVDHDHDQDQMQLDSANGDSIGKTLVMEEDPKSEDEGLNYDMKVQVQELCVENAGTDSQEGKIDYEANVGLVVLSVKPVNDENHQTVVIDTAHDVVDQYQIQLDSANGDSISKTLLKEEDPKLEDECLNHDMKVQLQVHVQELSVENAGADSQEGKIDYEADVVALSVKPVDDDNQSVVIDTAHDVVHHDLDQIQLDSANGDSIDKTLLMEDDPKSEDGCLNHDMKVQFHVQELSVENAGTDSQEGKIDYEANVGLLVLSVNPVNDENETVVIETAHDVVDHDQDEIQLDSANGDSIGKTLLKEEDPKSENGCLNHDMKVQFQELSVENAEADSQEGKIDYEANVRLVVLSVKPVNDENQTVVIDTAHDVVDHDQDQIQLNSAISTLDEPGQFEHGEENLEEPEKTDVDQNSQESGFEVYLSEEVAKFFPFVPEDQVPVLTSSNVENEDESDLKLEYEMKNSYDKRSVMEDQHVNDGANTANLKIPFNYLIKVPIYDDESLREQIENTEQEIEETTKFRDLIKAGIKIIKAKSQELHAIFESAKSEKKSAWDLVQSKRQEIEAAQSVINRVNNAIAVDDIDLRIRWMEQMIEHKTLLLKDERCYISEIKQLKTLREGLYSSMGSNEEVQQAFSQKDGAEERMKILRKELNQLKNSFSDAEEATKVAWWKYDDEKRKMNGLYLMFTTEDDVRQEEFRHLKNLQNQLRDKNVWFMRYKDEESFANDFAASGDEEVLHPFSMNQVEGIMEEWNKNDEFRTIYIRSNASSTLKRFRTLDGRELSHDEEESLVEEANNAMHISVDHSMVITPTKEEDNNNNNNNEVSMEKRTYEMQQTDIEEEKLLKTKRCSGKISEPIMDDESVKTHEMKEELVAKNEEDDEEGTRLKEQQRKEEEKAKAKEALERKRRNAEKAMARAELWAQKEAEMKEKEKEKKARKKDKKKEGGTEGEDDDDDSREGEEEEGGGELRKRSLSKTLQFGKKQSKSKSIPPPTNIRNKGKKRIEQWISAVILIVIVLALFLLGNIGIYSNLKSRSFNNQHYN